MTARRLPSGGLIDRSQPLRFTFNGKTLNGYVGDSLASALLASDQLLLGRSFKYHRPRGLMSAGIEEPNALVQLESGDLTAPNVRATCIELYEGLKATSQNAWPSVDYDLGEINRIFGRFLPSGFYYKTFMWPASMWLTYEKVIRNMAGLGKAPEGEDCERYDHLYHHCDVLVVGSGPSGLMAAQAAAKGGADVILVEQDDRLGGALLSAGRAETINNQPPLTWLSRTLPQLEAQSGLTILTRTTLSGYFDDNYLLAAEDRTGHLPLESRQGVRRRLHKIRAARVIIATGALERPLTFENNDLPGIMLAGALRRYLNRYAVLPGQTMIIATNNDSAYSLAEEAHMAGAQTTIIDSRPRIDPDLAATMVNHNIAVFTNTVVVSAHGYKRLKRVRIGSLDEGGTATVGALRTLECDCLAMAGGFNPVVHLHSQARGKLAWRDDIMAFVPMPDPDARHDNAGACAGLWSLKACLSDGWRAGTAALAALGYKAPPRPRLAVHERDETTPLRMIWRIAGSGTQGLPKGKQFVDFQNDVTAEDVMLAAREGYLSVEHLKRYTTTGMGTDQGKTSNVTALALMADKRGLSIPEVGTTTFRPPYTPLSFGAMSGQHRRHLYAPVRTTPMHESEVALGATFECVGDWMRAWFYPKAGETMSQAVKRECLTVRQGVGLFDGSTLGKIDLQGRDAAAFLNRLYTNAWLKLGIGHCRYGLMLNEQGMVYDDGVSTRLADNHFHMTTTTGGAARVLGAMEEWLQTEWPDLQVYCTSVTEEWAVATLAGPKARDVLASVSDFEVSNEAFPFMTMREGKVCGVKARVFRISFSGELGYEINVPARFGRYLWDELYQAGQPQDITPYGTETMHVLRAEKGFIITGQDTDGTVTPSDLAMDWIVNMTKGEFIGRRSLSRSDTAREGRKHLVGLLPERKDFIMPRGLHFVEKGTPSSPPFEHLGHVSSTYYSPTMDRAFGLGLIKNGQARIGDIIYGRTLDGKEEAVQITHPVFVDPEGGRSRG